MGRLTDSVETRMTEAATTRSADVDGLRSEMTKRIEELQRTGSTIRERVDAVVQQTSAVADDVGALRVEAKAGTARNDELEKRVKAAVGRLAASVETRLAEFAAQSTEETTTQLAQMADQRRAELEDTVTARLQEMRDEIRAAADKTQAQLDALDASVPVALRDAEARLRQAMQAKQGDLEAVATRVAKARTEMNATLASVHRKLARTEDLVERRLAVVGDQVDALTKTAATEVGSLAPLRSDLRRLQGQVAELAEVVAELRPKRKAPAKKAAASPAKKVAAAPAKKATAKKAPRRKA
jgi:heparin binding hemagglutinin HbhA